MSCAGRVPALQMDFDFKEGGGFVVARRALNRPMPKRGCRGFRLRGRGARIDLELKLVDATGQNVWRNVKKDLALAPRWKTDAGGEQTFFEFAWGPSSRRHFAVGFHSVPSSRVRAARARCGLRTRVLNTESGGRLRPVHRARCRILKPLLLWSALDGSRVPDDLRPWIVIDSIQPRTLGGLIIDWLGDAPASDFQVRASNSGHRWKTLQHRNSAGGNRSYVYLPGLKTRFLRLQLAEPSAGAALRPQSFEFSRSIHAFWHNIADAEARG